MSWTVLAVLIVTFALFLTCPECKRSPNLPISLEAWCNAPLKRLQTKRVVHSRHVHVRGRFPWINFRCRCVAVSKCRQTARTRDGPFLPVSHLLLDFLRSCSL